MDKVFDTIVRLLAAHNISTEADSEEEVYQRIFEGIDKLLGDDDWLLKIYRL